MDLENFFEDGMKEKYKKLLSNTAKPLLDKDAKLLDITPFVTANNAYKKRIKAEEEAYAKAQSYRAPEDFIDAEIEPAIDYVEEEGPHAPQRNRRKRALSNFFENVWGWLKGAFRWLGEAFSQIGHWLAVAFRWLGPAILWLLKWCGLWLLRISLFAIVPLGMIIFTIILFVNPTLIYCYLHWGWIVGVFVALLIGVLAVTFFISSNDFSYKVLRLTILVAGTVVGFGMMIGAMASYSPELIEISSVSEMNLIKNVPGGRNRDFVLTQDIDFNGGSFEQKTFTLFFSTNLGFTGTFDGNGHTIKNAKSFGLYTRLEGGTIQNIVFDNVEGIRIVDYNDGTISNITIQNSSFSIQSAVCEGIVVHKNRGTLSDVTLKNLNFSVGDLSAFELVCYSNSETIENLNIDSVTITGEKVRDFAGVAEANYGTIENAHLSNFHVNAEVQTAHFIVLESQGTEKNCSTQNCYINDIQSKHSGSISL